MFANRSSDVNTSASTSHFSATATLSAQRSRSGWAGNLSTRCCPTRSKRPSRRSKEHQRHGRLRSRRVDDPVQLLRQYAEARNKEKPWKLSVLEAFKRRRLGTRDNEGKLPVFALWRKQARVWATDSLAMSYGMYSIPIRMFELWSRACADASFHASTSQYLCWHRYFSCIPPTFLPFLAMHKMLPLPHLTTLPKSAPRSFTSGTLPSFIDPKQPPVKKQPFAAVRAQKAVSSLSLVLPEELAALVEQEVNARRWRYAKVIMKLGDLLEGDLFTEGVKKGK